jgi:hypothetical protein
VEGWIWRWRVSCSAERAGRPRADWARGAAAAGADRSVAAGGCRRPLLTREDPPRAHTSADAATRTARARLAAARGAAARAAPVRAERAMLR